MSHPTRSVTSTAGPARLGSRGPDAPVRPAANGRGAQYGEAV
ncbi:hypothetical protein [Streptomyces sp. NPDC048142]